MGWREMMISLASCDVFSPQEIKQETKATLINSMEICQKKLET